MNVTRRSIALLPLAACAHAEQIDQTPFDGEWRGVWVKQGAELPVVVHIGQSADGYSGSFDSDDLQVVGIPFRTIERAGSAVHIVLAGDTSTTTFDGALVGDRLAGTFAEGENAGTFALTRVAAAAPALSVGPIMFANGDVMLSGEVVSASSNARGPGIVFLQGSGPEGRWANRHLAHQFARAGFSALIFDKRGVGDSGGDWRTSDFEALAEDGAAAARALAQRAEIDPARVGVYGHSQGANVAPLVARRTSARFVIGSAATGVSPADTEIYSVANSIGAASLAPSERTEAMEFVRALVSLAHQGAERADLDRMSERYRDRPWFFELPPPDNFYWSFSRRIAAFDSVSAWSEVRSPTLLLWGAGDERVPPQVSADALSAAMANAGNAHVTTRLYPGADHAFQLVAAPGPWPRRVPGYVDAMIAWALEVSR